MILTKAVSGLARSGATRSGYPVLLGYKVPLYALSNLARSGATRSNYHSARPFISIDGIQRGWATELAGGVLAASLTKTDQVSGTPDTLAFTAYGWVPVEGDDVIVTLGSINNLRREFGGTILSTVHRYARKPAPRNMLYDVSCIDYTWRLNQRKVSGNYTNASVAAVAASLMTAAADYTLRVDPDIGAELLDQITFTEQALSDALTQLVKRVGGEYLVDYAKGVHLFYENTEITPPMIVNAVHPTLATISWTRDLSQVVTRCLGNFGGSDALEAIAPGATLLPVETAAWYLPQGGTVLVGQQRVSYGGLVAAGGGSLVGPGAAPTGTPNATVIPGPGVDVGAHDYALTYLTASGESIPGPRLTVPVGVFLPPGTAPTPGTPGPGVGPDPGAHEYAVSFVIATGETAPGPRAVASTTWTPAPTTGPSPDNVSVGAGPDPGPHDYAVSFVTATGETLVGPIGSQITTGGIPAPTNAPSPGSVTTGPGPDIGGPHVYATTFVRPEGETTPSPISGPVTTGNLAPPSSGPSGSAAVGVGLTVGVRQYATTFVTAQGETTPGAITSLTTPSAPGPSSAPTWDGTSLPGGQLAAGIFPANQWTWAYTFVTASGETAISARVGTGNSSSTPPTPYTSYQIAFPLGPPGTIARKLYRTRTQPTPAAAQAAALGYEATLADNTTLKRYMGTVYDNDLGAGPPSPPTAALGIMNLSGIPVGPAGTLARNLYRTVANGTALQLVTTIADNTTRSYTDTTPDSGLGAAPPTVNTSGGAQTVSVSSIATGDPASGVIARNLYRTVANGNTLLLVTTIPDNTTRSYTDTTPDAGLGAAAPTSNTTTGGLQTVHVSSIPRGPGGSGSAVLQRRLYRRSGGVELRALAYLPDNAASTYTDVTPNAGLGAAPPAANTAALRQIPLTAVPLGNTLVVARNIYRTVANTAGGTLKRVATVNDNTTTDFLDTVTDAALGVAALGVGTAQAAQVQLSAIPIGAAAVIARVLYRTKAGATPLQRLTTIADNVTTAWLDTAADATLGAAAPSSDTSLLQQPQGNVFAGSPTLPCASVAAFRPAGGWAIAGSQILRYTGISGNAIIGIPASGPGAITAAITYNNTVVAAPLLIGIPAAGLGAIKYQILKGDPVNIFIQVDDLDAQAALRAQLRGSDGIIEDEIQDGRLSYTEGRARCQARLDLLATRDSEGKVGVITVSYVCRDINTQAGATVTVNLGPPVSLRGEYLIQRVNVARFNLPAVHPTYSVEASSLRFSAEELLRLLRQGFI